MKVSSAVYECWDGLSVAVKPSVWVQRAHDVLDVFCFSVHS